MMDTSGPSLVGKTAAEVEAFLSEEGLPADLPSEGTTLVQFDSTTLQFLTEESLRYWSMFS